MKFVVLIKDAFRYAAADWYNVLILGVVIFLAENLDHLPGNSPGLGVYDSIVYIIIFFLICMEAGYFHRIIKETVNGSVDPPRLNKLQSLFSHGFKEVLVFFIYFSIPIIILALAAFEFQPYMHAIFLNPQIFAHYIISDMVYYYLIPSMTPAQFDAEFVLYILLVLITAIIVYFIFLAALLNMAHHHGTIRSGLDIPSIYQRLKNVGVKKLLVVYILLATVTLLLGVELFYDIPFIPIIYQFDVVDLLVQLFILPYLLIFTIRLLGLIGKTPTTIKNTK